MRKGQGLSMNVIIIAALALLVLVILSVVFMSRSSIFVSDSKSCENLGGSCVPDGSDCPGGMIERNIGTAVCLNNDGSVNEDMKCCMPGEEI
ncbi:MAG: hypothetical protein ACLFP2_00530 [Candidatus Woesearchaeota archaeon]